MYRWCSILDCGPEEALPKVYALINIVVVKDWMKSNLLKLAMINAEILLRNG